MGNFYLLMAVASFGGVALFAIMHSAVRVRGTALAQKFRSLGTLKGKTLDEITREVGPPNAQSGLPGGKMLRQWMATGYHIALRFDTDGTCEGVTHEVKV